MEEVWVQIKGMKLGFKISSQARCVNPDGRILKPHLTNKKIGGTWVYRCVNIDEGYCNPSIHTLMLKSFPEIDICSIEKGKYKLKRLGHKGCIERSVEEIIKTIQSNTDSKNKTINSLLITFLEKGDNYFGPIMNDCYKSLSVVAKKSFDKHKKKFYNHNINRKKVDIAETHEDLLQDFCLKLMGLLKRGMFDGRKFYSWTMRILTTDILVFFLNMNQFGIKEDKVKTPRKFKTKEENLKQRQRINQLQKTYKSKARLRRRKITTEEAIFERDINNFSLFNLL